MTKGVLTIADKVELGLITAQDPRAVRAKKAAERRVGHPMSFNEWFAYDQRELNAVVA